MIDQIREWCEHAGPHARHAIGGGIEGLGWYVLLAGALSALLG